MQKRNRIVSAVLSIALMTGIGCAPDQVEPNSGASNATQAAAETEKAEFAPKQENVTALASAPYTIAWNDFSRTTTTYQCTEIAIRSCLECSRNNYPAYVESGCQSTSDTRSCTYCAQSTPTTTRVPLPDGDLIDVTIEHNMTASDGIEFRLESAPNVTWWKQVALIGGGDTWTVWNQDGQSWCNWPQAQTANCNTNSQWANVVLASGTRFRFSKAKVFGWHTEMYNLYNLHERLTDGDRVTFRWVQDTAN